MHPGASPWTVTARGSCLRQGGMAIPGAGHELIIAPWGSPMMVTCTPAAAINALGGITLGCSFTNIFEGEEFSDALQETLRGDHDLPVGGHAHSIRYVARHRLHVGAAMRQGQ